MENCSDEELILKLEKIGGWGMSPSDRDFILAQALIRILQKLDYLRLHPKG